MSETNSAGDDARTGRDAPPTKKPDAAVLGRGETHIPDEDAVLLTDGGIDTADDMAYWRRNLEAALSSMEPETAVTPRHNADDLVITPVGGSTRQERAELIHALEVRGFEVISSSQGKYIKVDVTDDRLDYPFVDEDRRAMTDGGTSTVSNGGSPDRFPELVGFHRDILLVLARSQPTNGQGLLADLSTLRDEKIYGSRLYRNLGELVDAGLVDKEEFPDDDRAHEFQLSANGQHALREHAQRLEGAVEALSEDQS